MSAATPGLGRIAWTDLTVDDADSLRSFYHDVVGWKSESLSMGSYDDYNMLPPDGTQPVAGICHARGSNAELPPVWLIYVAVENLDDRLQTCRRLGGMVLAEPTNAGGGRIAVIRDPSGAALALYEEA